MWNQSFLYSASSSSVHTVPAESGHRHSILPSWRRRAVMPAGRGGKLSGRVAIHQHFACDASQSFPSRCPRIWKIGWRQCMQRRRKAPCCLVKALGVSGGAGVSTVRAGRGVGATSTTGQRAPAGGPTNDCALRLLLFGKVERAANSSCTISRKPRQALLAPSFLPLVLPWALPSLYAAWSNLVGLVRSEG